LVSTSLSLDDELELDESLSTVSDSDFALRRRGLELFFDFFVVFDSFDDFFDVTVTLTGEGDDLRESGDDLSRRFLDDLIDEEPRFIDERLDERCDDDFGDFRSREDEDVTFCETAGDGAGALGESDLRRGVCEREMLPK